MDTITLQIKRVTGNWEDNQGHKPADGEYVLIDVDGMVKKLVLGDGSKTLAALYTTSATIIPFESNVDAMIDALQPNVVPLSVGTSASKGVSGRYALQDHRHALDKTTAESVLETNQSITSNFACRRIMAGTAEPDPNKGKVGDIYIKYVE